MQDINRENQNMHQGKIRPKLLNHNLKTLKVKYTYMLSSKRMWFN